MAIYLWLRVKVIDCDRRQPGLVLGIGSKFGSHSSTLAAAELTRASMATRAALLTYEFSSTVVFCKCC